MPDPALPEGLELRLTAALDSAAGPGRTRAGPAGTAGESGSGTGDGAEGGGQRPAQPGVTPFPRRVRSAWLPAAAASLVLVLGGGLGYALLQGSGTEAQDAAISAAGGAAESDRSSEESSDSALSVPAAAPPRSATGADYADEAEREAVLPRVLAGPDPDDVPAELLPDGPLASLRSPQVLDACLSAVTEGSDVAPVALDEGVFRGDPALAVVLPSADPREVVVHVVGADCGASDPDELLVVRASRR
jgi:hypothetical protein